MFIKLWLSAVPLYFNVETLQSIKVEDGTLKLLLVNGRALEFPATVLTGAALLTAAEALAELTPV